MQWKILTFSTSFFAKYRRFHFVVQAYFNLHRMQLVVEKIEEDWDDERNPSRSEDVDHILPRQIMLDPL